MSLLRSALLALLATSAAAQGFVPRFILPGTVRIWGDTAMTSVVLAWEDRFQLYHPEIRFTNNLYGSDTGMGALYSGSADLALLGRESNQTENDGFLHSLQYTPLKLRLLNGSLDTPCKSPALVFFVSDNNPLTEITMEQAARALGGPRQNPARTWGDLGVTAAWATHPLHVYTFDMESGTGLFLLEKLQGPGKKMNWAAVLEFVDARHHDGTNSEAAQQTVEALRRDPDGLAVSTLRYAGPGVKALPLARGSLQAVAPSPATIVEGTYPLARATYAFVNHPPNQTMPQPVTEFLRFVLSPEGQALVAGQSGFLPLSSQDADIQTHMLTK